MTLNIHPQVWPWFRRQELDNGITKTRLVQAGIAALRFLGSGEREAMVQWATLIDEDQVTWAEFDEWCSANQKQREQSLRRVLARAIGHELAAHPGLPEGRQAGKAGA
ncbi:MAG: hypothetical protein J5J06_05505 [Phycisphaerae bacterium]|nr:hypothetical protein [Phycisphaerae bacterium]